MIPEQLYGAVARCLSLPERSVAATVRLLDDGATIPFISRYRKEATGELDEVAVAAISKEVKRLRELDRRKEYIIETVCAQGKLTPELKEKIESESDAARLEDIFAPYRPRKRTRAAVAREKGLEPLAAILMAQNVKDVQAAAGRFVRRPDVGDAAEAIEGAKDIVAEWVSDNARVRGKVRNVFSRTAQISASVVKDKVSEASKYANYDGYTRRLRDIPSHNYLALRRGEREGLLKVSVIPDNDSALRAVTEVVVKRGGSPSATRVIGDAVADSYKRLLRPAMETEVSSAVKDRADREAIGLFASNLEQLLLAPPLGRKRILAIDPGYRTGCKIVCLDSQGNLLHHDVIYPCAPRNDRSGAEACLRDLTVRFDIDAVAVGNGTAGRETETFVRGIDFGRHVEVYSVNESGASVYSASALAREEFPDHDVTVRGAVSIGRRLLDPLAELVKIDPQSIGVGQYQHDVDQTALREALDFTVMSCVNRVGVNLNTASAQLLSYVSGLGPAMARKIVDYRAENGDFATRSDLLKVPRLGEKTYQQCAGFLRIPGSPDPLDNTAVHPQDYKIVERMAKDMGCDVSALISDRRILDSIDLTRYVTPDRGMPTLTDIMAELRKPGRDPRMGESETAFSASVETMEQLAPGMELNGIVNNITAFGVFVDVGVKESGLVHVSELSDRYVSSPSDVVRLNQHVRVKVLDIDLSRRRISLTMKGVMQ